MVIRIAFNALKEIQFNMIQSGADSNECYNKHNTDLMLAVLQRDDKRAFELIDAGTNLDDANVGGYTALMLAVKEGRDKFALKLIAAGANVDVNRFDKIIFDIEGAMERSASRVEFWALVSVMFDMETAVELSASSVKKWASTLKRWVSRLNRLRSFFHMGTLGKNPRSDRYRRSISVVGRKAPTG